MNDLDAVHRTVADVAHHIDFKRWADLRVLFADETAIDYTSLFGGTPQRQTADALIGGWRAVLAGVTTQHLLGPITVQLEGDRATARCHVRALHFARGLPGGSESPQPPPIVGCLRKPARNRQSRHAKTGHNPWASSGVPEIH